MPWIVVVDREPKVGLCFMRIFSTSDEISTEFTPFPPSDADVGILHFFRSPVSSRPELGSGFESGGGGRK